VRVESPSRLNDHRPKSVKTLRGDVVPEVNRHVRPVWLTWRPGDVRVRRVAKTMPQELVNICRRHSKWRVSQKLRSDTVIRLTHVDYNDVRGPD